ncbi:tetratricopeptide repeat protein [Niabella ginsengisoli]|uniref:Tetratricopeptide repeat protein n=1 Tax=Niabella ginsengisoli TaxID=522298 RepID=A0ABS9SFB2_9BACT|nr:tetratricopeptide repeat protein [Niabella ginsengisoli]MCH5597035.1 tetratricopeptide repeat protein [Niabella ginsengisoli]
MKDFSQHDEEKDQELSELLQRYEDFRGGRGGSYIEEEAFEKIIEHFEAQEQFLKALQAVEIATEQFPYSASLLIKKADLLLNRRKYEQALTLLEQASIFDNNNIDIYILKTEAFLALDRQEEAVELLKEALEFFEGEDKIELLFELADVYDDYEDFEKVFDCLKEILQQEPDNEEALYKICFWTDYTGRNAESIELHKKIIDETPYNELAWFNLGAAFQGLKLYEKAIDAYQYALVIDEKMDYAYRNIGDAYIRLRKYKDAIEYLEKVLELSKPEDVIYEAIGFCYEKMKNYALARFYYRKASHLNPDISYLAYKIAYTYYKEEKYEMCVKQLDTALKLKRNKPEYSILMGDCKMQLGFTKEAIQYFSNVVRLKPKSAVGWEALIKCLYDAEYYDEASKQIDNALTMTKNKPIFIYYRALIQFAQGKKKQALIYLEEALISDPGQFKRFYKSIPPYFNINKWQILS